MPSKTWQRLIFEKQYIDLSKALDSEPQAALRPLALAAFEQAMSINNNEMSDPKAQLQAMVLFFIALERNTSAQSLSQDQEDRAFVSIEKRLSSVGADNSRSRLFFLNKRLTMLK